MKKNRKKIKRKTLFHDGSVNRWPNYLFNIWPFTTIKIGPMAFIICKNRLRILSNRDFKIFHKGEISPNLVTLSVKLTRLCLKKFRQPKVKKEEKRSKFITPIKPTSSNVYETEYSQYKNSALSGLQVRCFEILNTL